MCTVALAWISAKYKVKFEGLYILTFFLDIALFSLLSEIL